MRITTRLRIISTVTIAALVALAPLLIWSFIEFKNAKNDYVLANVILDNFFERASLRDQYFLYHEDRVRTQWDKNKETSDRLLHQAEVLFQDEKGQQLLKQLRGHIEDTAVIFHRIANNNKVVNTATDNRQVYAELDKRLSSQLLLKANAVRDTATALKDESAQDVELTYQRLTFIIGLFAFTLALAIILTTMQISRLIRKRLAPLHDGAKIVADGNLDYRLKSGGSDEFAELAVSINAMTDRLREEIGAHRQTEELRHKAAEETEDLYDHAPCGYHSLDRDGIIRRINDTELAWLGYTRDEVVGRMKWPDLITPASQQTFRENFPRLKAHGFVRDLEIEITRKNGTIFIGLINATAICDSSGDFVMSRSTVFDITGRKRMEDALRLSERRFHDVSDAAGEYLWEVDANIVYTYVSSRSVDVKGYSPEELLGHTPMEFMPEEDIAPVGEIVSRAIANKAPFNLQHRDITKSGAVLWEEVNGVPFYDENGTVIGLRGAGLNITERKQAEAELKRSNTELEQFSYAVSHDMRQPLRMISSYLQLLEMSLADQLDGEKRDYFNFAIDGAKRIDQMLIELLEYSRVGRMGEPPAWIESQAVLDEALQFLQPAITEAQANLNISGDWPRIFASHDEILRLLQNLIGNAAKFRVAGRIPEITVTSEIVKNEWHLCVADNGVGIIPDQIKRLFQVFQRLQSREAYEGTGIGLALCRKIAEHHKGRIWAESAGEGQGCKFYVVLPVSQMKTTLQ